jgi:esterase/lipase
MKILFLHGLEGGPSNYQQMALLAHGEVIYPLIKYRTSTDPYQDLFSIAQDRKCDVIIGLGLGGLFAFYLSCNMNVPCLIINPMLPTSNDTILFPEQRSKRTQYLQVVLGKDDLLVNANDRLLFLENNNHDQFNYSIHLINQAASKLTLSEFRLELSTFFNIVNFKRNRY